MPSVEAVARSVFKGTVIAVETREPYEVHIELHAGGTLHLTLSDQDKILVIRSFIESLPLKDQIVHDFLRLLEELERKSKPIDIWKLKLDGVKTQLLQAQFPNDQNFIC